MMQEPMKQCPPKWMEDYAASQRKRQRIRQVWSIIWWFFIGAGAMLCLWILVYGILLNITS